ncbi:hypothetical protein H6F77_08505 [Microcoleus sp. FACHB-831]|uniref:hypothetical protein n=1 Tax=Microcoleus sp. FACHB-831 TaxID=2692827 RepID=UPI0016885A81|nr:hypothetical protein [Microcoleus sp. FACHB-831]MBD1921131.1 hypothetical protein [Microcoleus sp. FACHB-831]
MITVKVFYKDSGKPADSKKVALGIDGFFSGGVTKDQWTDEDGEAHFDTESCTGRIFVNGSIKYEGRIAGRMVVYI